MKALSVLFIVLGLSCNSKINQKKSNKNMTTVFSVISNPSSSKEGLLKALAKLGPVEEHPVFWTDIANNDKFSEGHRRRAVYMLFKRHVKIGISLQTLGEILNEPTWLKKIDISLVQELAGKIPVEFNFDDTILAIQIFSNLSDGRFENWSIFLRVAGKISVEDFYQIISSGGRKGMKELKERKLLEFGLSPDTSEINH